MKSDVKGKAKEDTKVRKIIKTRLVNWEDWRNWWILKLHGGHEVFFLQIRKKTRNHQIQYPLYPEEVFSNILHVHRNKFLQINVDLVNLFDCRTLAPIWGNLLLHICQQLAGSLQFIWNISVILNNRNIFPFIFTLPVFAIYNLKLSSIWFL